MTAEVLIIKSNIALSFNIPSQIIWPTFYFGCGLVDEGCAYKSWNKQQGGISKYQRVVMWNEDTFLLASQDTG